MGIYISKLLCGGCGGERVKGIEFLQNDCLTDWYIEVGLLVGQCFTC